VGEDVTLELEVPSLGQITGYGFIANEVVGCK
jgi:hypothetical protein